MVAYLEDREFGGKQSFALGCPALIPLLAPWVGGPVDSDGGQPYFRSRGRVTDPNTFNRILGEYPVVADLPCDGSIQRYAPAGEPGAIVVVHRNGQPYRHYVDSPEWFTALNAGNRAELSAQAFRNMFPNRGIDFHAPRIR